MSEVNKEQELNIENVEAKELSNDELEQVVGGVQKPGVYSESYYMGETTAGRQYGTRKYEIFKDGSRKNIISQNKNGTYNYAPR